MGEAVDQIAHVLGPVDGKLSFQIGKYVGYTKMRFSWNKTASGVKYLHVIKLWLIAIN